MPLTYKAMCHPALRFCGSVCFILWLSSCLPRFRDIFERFLCLFFELFGLIRHLRRRWSWIIFFCLCLRAPLFLFCLQRPAFFWSLLVRSAPSRGLVVAFVLIAHFTPLSHLCFLVGGAISALFSFIRSVVCVVLSVFWFPSPFFFLGRGWGVFFDYKTTRRVLSSFVHHRARPFFGGLFRCVVFSGPPNPQFSLTKNVSFFLRGIAFLCTDSV